MFLAIGTTLAALYGVVASQCTDKVVTPYGNITAGEARSDGGCAWYNIPYAEPPVGNLRYAPPSPKTPWAAFDASTPNNVACVQFPGIYGATSEDCLYLIIYSSDGNLTASHDVLFWVPGGGLLVGGAYRDLYSFINRQPTNNPTVVVSINYRVGALGFLYDADLIDGDAFAGNYGYLDVRQALFFVRDVISAFGGDPAKITAVGQSSGAQLVSFLQLDEQVKSMNALAATVQESNPWGALTKTPGMWWDMPLKFRTALNCTHGDAANMRACMLAKTEGEVLQATISAFLVGLDYFFNCNFGLQWFSPFYTTVGTPSLPIPSFFGTIIGNMSDIPSIRGSNDAEMDAFIYGALWFPNPINQTQYLSQIYAWYYPMGEQVARYYENSGVRASLVADPTADDFRPLLSKVVSDATFACPASTASTAFGFHGFSSPQYVYQFDYAWSDMKKLQRPSQCDSVACHDAEMPFVFAPAQNRTRLPFSFTAAEELLASNIQTFWARTASGTLGAAPYGPSNSTTWPQFASAQESLRFMADGTLAQATWRARDEHHCAFWENVTWPNLVPDNDPGQCVRKATITRLLPTEAPTTASPSVSPSTAMPTGKPVTSQPTPAPADGATAVRPTVALALLAFAAVFA